jgi:photosystem II stability/assembly factor-like uncharacterized protein
MKKTILLSIAFVLIGINTFAQWEVLSSGSTESLKSVCFIDPNTGYAVGDYGTILKTNDGGATWNSQASGTDQELIYVCSPEANSIFVVARNGMILKTTDGGTSWNVQLSGSDFNLASVYFIDENTIYAVGSHWDSAVILSCTNGGTWNIKYTVIMEWPVIWLTSVCFSDVNTGYVVGGKAHANQTAGLLLKTTDGGTTWDYLPAESAPLNSVYFTDNETGYIVGGFCCELGCNGKIQKTTDGGTVWTEQTIPSSTGILNSVWFTDAVTGYAAGDNGTILKTTDEGATWNFQSSDAIQSLNSIYFFDVNTGYIVGVDGTILKTNNEGLPAGIIKKQQTNNLNICPSPAKENITIKINELGSNINGTIFIYGMGGQEMIQQQVGGTSSEINVSLLPKGIYFIKLVNNEKIDFGKFIKN